MIHPLLEFEQNAVFGIEPFDVFVFPLEFQSTSVIRFFQLIFTSFKGIHSLPFHTFISFPSLKSELIPLRTFRLYFERASSKQVIIIPLIPGNEQ